MTTQNTTEFSIENAICPITKAPFGSKYAGKFAIMRPSIKDKLTISLKDAAAMSAYGISNPEQMLSEGIKLLSYIVNFVEVSATAPVPEWFDLTKMYEDEDEEAILAVWNEIKAFLESFRIKPPVAA